MRLATTCAEALGVGGDGDAAAAVGGDGSVTPEALGLGRNRSAVSAPLGRSRSSATGDERERAGVEAGQVEQVGHQPLQPPRLAGDHARRPRPTSGAVPSLIASA